MPDQTNIPTVACPALDDEEPLDWSPLLRRATTPVDPATLAAPFVGKRILITGAGGSIGSALAKCIAQLQPAHLVLLDSSEHSLYELQTDLDSLPDTAPYIAIPGSVCDASLIHEILALHRPQLVYHAAAYKHVPFMEHHPLAALQTNALGTYTLAQACLDAGVEQFILLSTDKAVSPSSIMGASKRIAEFVLLALSDGAAQMKALRLGNVLGSRGSVVPLFQKQITQGGPVTVTDPEVRRYFLPLRESIELLLSLARPDHSNGIYIPNIGDPIRILDLAHFLIKNAASANNVPITFTGLRLGDKMQEELLASNESIDASISPAPLHKLHSPHSASAEILETLHKLQHAVADRDTPRALQVLQRLLPQYQPSDLLRPRTPHPVAT